MKLQILRTIACKNAANLYQSRPHWVCQTFGRYLVFTWVMKMGDLVTVVPSDYKFNLCVFFNDVKLFILNDAIL